MVLSCARSVGDMRCHRIGMASQSCRQIALKTLQPLGVHHVWGEVLGDDGHGFGFAVLPFRLDVTLLYMLMILCTFARVSGSNLEDQEASNDGVKGEATSCDVYLC